MPNTGRGNFPFNSSWFGVGRGRGRGRGRGLLRKAYPPSADARSVVLADYFFDAASPTAFWTHLTTLSDTSNADTYTTASVTLPGNSLLVVGVVGATTLTSPATVTSSAGITFTQVQTATRASVDTVYVFVANALTASDPGDSTFTFDCTGDTGAGAVIFVAALQGGFTRTGSSAVRQSAGNNQAGGTTPNATQTLAIQHDNPVFAIASNAANPAALTPPTGFTEQADTGFATPDRGAQYATRDFGSILQATTWGATSATAWAGVVVEFDRTPVVGGLGGAITPANETDAAQTLGRAKSKGFTPATETDAAQTLARRKSRSLTPSTEADAAQTLTRGKARSLTPATETDAAQALARFKSRGITPATETDSAQALTRGKARSLVAAVTSDIAQALGRVKSRSLTPATETDSAITLTEGGALGGAITPATETDTAQTLGRRKSRAVTPAAETDAAQVLSRTKSRSITPTTEADAAQALARTKSRSITPATVVDAAIALLRRKSKSITPATETDTAQTLTGGLTGGGAPTPVTLAGRTPQARIIAAPYIARTRARTPSARITPGPFIKRLAGRTPSRREQG